MVILLGHLLNCIMKLIDDIHSIFIKSMEPILGQIWFLGSVEAVAGKIALQSVFRSQNAFLGSSVHPSLNSLLRKSVWSWLILVYKYQIAPGSISGRLVILELLQTYAGGQIRGMQVFLNVGCAGLPWRSSGNWASLKQLEETAVSMYGSFRKFFGLEFDLKA